MNCQSINIIATLPYPYYSKYNSWGDPIPDGVLDNYVRIYRKELTSDIVISFITYKGDIHERLLYLLRIYKLSDTHNFDFSLSPSLIEKLYLSKGRMSNSEFMKILNILTKNRDIFIGDDLDLISNLLDSRSFKIYQITGQ